MSLPHEKRMDDGHATFFMLEAIPDIKLFEKEVTPPSLQAGGPIDTTTMRNLSMRTQSPKQLKTLGQVSATVAYASEVVEDIYLQLGVNQRVTITYPDGARYRFWGWLDSFTPGAHVEGEQPTAEIVVQPSNHNNDDEEAPPVYHDSTEDTSTE